MALWYQWTLMEIQSQEIDKQGLGKSKAVSVSATP